MKFSKFLVALSLMPIFAFASKSSEEEERWAYETLSKMTFEEKIGQLFVIPLSLKTPRHLQRAQDLISKNHVGGIIVKATTFEDHCLAMSKIKGFAKLPLLSAQDGENGLGFRYTDVIKYPFNLTLGAISDDHLVYKFGQQVGKQFALAGININFAPVVDVNSNPDNLVIFRRSFGGSVQNVIKKASLMMKGMKTYPVLPCLKHFPGHGNTTVDSHFALPVMFASLEDLEKGSLIPFRELAKLNADAVMTAHIAFPAIEGDTTPATFSSELITNQLKKKFQFQGLVITDALNMKALTNEIDPGEIAVRAFNAGNDVLLYGDHIIENIDEILDNQVPQALLALKLAYLEGSLDVEHLDQAVLKILKTKAKYTEQKDVDCSRILAEINSQEAFELRKELYRNAVTLVRDPSRIIASDKDENSVLFLIDPAETYQLEPSLTTKHTIKKFSGNEDKWIDEITERDFAIVELKDLGRSSKDGFGLSGNKLGIIEALKERNIPHLIVVLDHPYVVSLFPKESGVIIGYENTPEVVEVVGEVILEKFSPKGRLPI